MGLETNVLKSFLFHPKRLKYFVWITKSVYLPVCSTSIQILIYFDMFVTFTLPLDRGTSFFLSFYIDDELYFIFKYFSFVALSYVIGFYSYLLCNDDVKDFLLPQFLSSSP